MAQLTDDCFAFGGALLPLDDALAELRQRTACVVGDETVPLSEARGRVLAGDVVADRSVPPHDNSAVDGYAIRHADLDPAAATVLPVRGRAAAGHPVAEADTAGVAVRIFTGAPMPAGMDTVAMQEDCEAGGATVTIPPGLKPGANRRFAGEDVKAGSIILRAGCRLGAADIGLLASVGRAEVRVRRPLRVALLSTGDELAEPGTATPDGHVYDANRHALAHLLRGAGCEVADLGIVRDDPTAIGDALERAADRDLIVSSGGMSTGEEDHLTAAVNARGAMHFWRLSIKPGRPVGLGEIRARDRAVPFLGLPGNPVAAMVTFLLIGRPLIAHLCGAREPVPRRYPVRVDFDARKKGNRREFIRVSLHDGPAGELPRATRFPRDGAGILSSITDSNGFVELPEGVTHVSMGDVASYIPFKEFLP